MKRGTWMVAVAAFFIAFTVGMAFWPRVINKHDRIPICSSRYRPMCWEHGNLRVDCDAARVLCDDEGS